MKFPIACLILAFVLSASARPFKVNIRRQAPADVQSQNGKDAIALNDKFSSLNKNSSCKTGDQACIDNGFAQCVNGKFVVTPCAGGTTCKALPLINSPGTSISCTTQADFDQRIAATGANDSGKNGGKTGGTGKDNSGKNNSTESVGNGGNNNDDPQKSLTLDPAVVAKGFANNGQDQPSAGQVASLTSTNNFINFCLTSKLPLTNGKQVKTGSCNPAPMGVIAATTNIPSGKFQFPVNLGEVKAKKAFTIKFELRHLETGNFVNANENYFSAPQQVNKAGDIKGHSHVVIEKLTSLNQTTPTDPNKFAFFKGLNAAGNPLTADVTNGLEPGAYRLCSINTAANHQPVLVAVAQHGALDDCVYFTAK